MNNPDAHWETRSRLGGHEPHCHAVLRKRGRCILPGGHYGPHIATHKGERHEFDLGTLKPKGPLLYMTSVSQMKALGQAGDDGYRLTCLLPAQRGVEGTFDGLVSMLAPDPRNLALLVHRQMLPAEYRRLYVLRMKLSRSQGLLSPGKLTDSDGYALQHGDTVLVLGPTDKRPIGECELSWAAPFLRLAGWSPVLFGRAVR